MTDSNPTPTQSPSVVRSRWGRLLPWIGLFSLLVIVAAGMARSRPNAIAEGRPAPDFTLRTFEGEEIKLSSLRGKVVVLNFWA